MNILNIAFASLSIIGLTSCVEDKSDYTWEMEVNDNTYAPVYTKAALDEQQKAMINFFVDGAEPTTGLARNSDTDQALTPGPSGFGIMNIIAGVERGWITREDAVAHILKEARFLDQTAIRFDGAWSHWYNNQGNVVAFGNQTAAGEAVETAFWLAGMLCAEEYFTGGNADETEIRNLAEKFFNEVDWTKFIHDGTMYWIHHTDYTTNADGKDSEWELPIVGWNEALMTYILGLAAPDGHNIPQSVYKNTWLGGVYSYPNRSTYGYEIPLGSYTGGPLFLAQYSFLGLDPRQMKDDYCNYWKQNVAHTMINRHYCIYEAPAENAYTSQDWGLTACSGAGSTSDYVSRSPENDDGVIAPTAAISSMPYTPFYSMQVFMNVRKNYPKLNSIYGIAASYKPSEKKVNTNYLSYEHGPQAVMIENYRSGLFWKLLMNNRHIQTGLQRAGITKPNYTDGFYLAMPDVSTGVYDIMRHPDRGNYEIDFYASAAGTATVTVNRLTGENVYSTTADLTAGANIISFYDASIIRGKNYMLTVTEADGNNYSIKIGLH